MPNNNHNHCSSSHDAKSVSRLRSCKKEEEYSQHHDEASSLAHFFSTDPIIQACWATTGRRSIHIDRARTEKSKWRWRRSCTIAIHLPARETSGGSVPVRAGSDTARGAARRREPDVCGLALPPKMHCLLQTARAASSRSPPPSWTTMTDKRTFNTGLNYTTSDSRRCASTARTRLIFAKRVFDVECERGGGRRTWVGDF